MRMTETHRELIERALDELYDVMMDGDEAAGMQIVRATRLYVQAVSIVRDRLPGQRKVRSDILTKRPTPQGNLQIGEDRS